jgi:hypothetical protein
LLSIPLPKLQTVNPKKLRKFVGTLRSSRSFFFIWVVSDFWKLGTTAATVWLGEESDSLEGKSLATAKRGVKIRV